MLFHSPAAYPGIFFPITDLDLSLVILHLKKKVLMTNVIADPNGYKLLHNYSSVNVLGSIKTYSLGWSLHLITMVIF